MKITTDSIKVGNKTYSATTIDVDEIQIIKEKDVVKKHIIDKTLETCDDGTLVEQYKDICDFGSKDDSADNEDSINFIKNETLHIREAHSANQIADTLTLR